VTPEDLADADLGRTLRLVLVADHPQGHHVHGVAERAGLELEQAVLRRIQRDVALRLSDDHTLSVVVLADGAADGSREHPSLERRDPQMTGELGAPRFLVGLDEQAEHPATHRVAGCRSRPRAPVREVVWDPQPFVEDRPVETVLHLQFVTGPIEDCRWLAARQSVGHRAPLMLSPVDESHLGGCGKHLLIGEAVGWKVDSAVQAGEAGLAAASKCAAHFCKSLMSKVVWLLASRKRGQCRYANPVYKTQLLAFS
jgi:hypothetical protein